MKPEPRRAVPMRLQRDRALALCADLMRKLGVVPVDMDVEFELHHEPPLQLRAIDEAGGYIPPQHEPSCLVWMTKAAHRQRTTGRRGESDLSIRDGDIGRIAKQKRIEAKSAEFNSRLLRKNTCELNEPKLKPKQQIKSRSRPKAKPQRRASGYQRKGV